MHCPVCSAANVGRRCLHDVSFVSEVDVADVVRAACELKRAQTPVNAA